MHLVEITDSETKYDIARTIAIRVDDGNWVRAFETLREETWLQEQTGWEKYGEIDDSGNCIIRRMAKPKDMGEPRFAGVIDFLERAPDIDEDNRSERYWEDNEY